MNNQEIEVVILAAGLGTRFKDNGYRKPKPLINVFGKPMIFHVIESVRDANITIAYRKNMDNWAFRERIQKNYDNISFYRLGYVTKGPAETAYSVVDKIENKNNRLMIMDCDTIYHDDIVEKFKGVNQSAIYYFESTDTDPIYSYISTDKEGNFVEEIKEKDKISDKANSGVYCFTDSNLYLKYANKVLHDLIGESKEAYISDVYKQMLEGNHKILPIKVEDFDCVGTPTQLISYANNLNSEDNTKRRYCFDLDNTLVTLPRVRGDYSTVYKNEEIISLARKLKEAGNEIIIYTARRMRTHSGSAGKALADIGAQTFKTLEKFGIPYDEVYFGKPDADFYIDDKAISSYDNIEREIGFYRSHSDPRHFNNIEERGNLIVKTSEDYKTLEAEYNWYKNIPDDIVDLFPKCEWDSNEDSMKLEKIKGVPYSYLYVNHELKKFHIDQLLNSLNRIHTAPSLLGGQVDFEELYVNKFDSRMDILDIKSIKGHQYLSIDSFINRVRNSLQKHYERLKKTSAQFMMHGDPVFSNVFLDYKGKNKFIDMRGRIGDEVTVFGDKFYDYAKIYQSLRGYDHIVADSIWVDEKYIEEMSQYYLSKFNEEQRKIIREIAGSLILSLIPLHDCLPYKKKKFFDLATEVYLGY